MPVDLPAPVPPGTPFDDVADAYDDIFSDSPIGRAQRQLVWSEIDRVFHRGQRVLEINCGTGVDALRLAARGIAVSACDASPRMIAHARQRSDALPSTLPVEFRCVASEDLDSLPPEGFYDGALSNFAGLNCVAEPGAVGKALARRVRPGGHAVVCVFGTCSVWEILWHSCRGDLGKAFRRFRRGAVEASLPRSRTVSVRYHSVGSLRRAFAPWFRLERRRGVGVAVPPSYARSIPKRFPRLFGLAVRMDLGLGPWPGLRSLADHAVLVFERTGERAP